jgi:hypothetical protein
MNLTNIAIFGMGISFILMGLGMRKQYPEKNWKVFVIGGVTILVLEISSICFGWK